MKLNVLAASVAAATSLMFAGAAQAAVFVIDDWNISTGNAISATGIGNSSGPTPRTATGGVSLTRGNMFTTITTGGANAGTSIQDCPTCDFGTFSNDSGTAGWGYWSWTANNLNLSSYTDVALEYFSDLFGADIIMAFFDGATLAASAQASDLAATGGLPVGFSLPINLTGATAIDEVRLYVFSAGGSVNTGSPLGTINAGVGQSLGLDFGVRGLKTTSVPEPSSLALLGLSLAGLGFMRRRRT